MTESLELKMLRENQVALFDLIPGSSTGCFLRLARHPTPRDVPRSRIARNKEEDCA